MNEIPERQRRAIALATAERRKKLEPFRHHLDDRFCELGWKVCRPIVAEVMGFDPIRQRGSWWGYVGLRKGKKILQRLGALEMEQQGRLW